MEGRGAGHSWNNNRFGIDCVGYRASACDKISTGLGYKTLINKTWRDKTWINKTWSDKTWINKTLRVIKHGYIKHGVIKQGVTGRTSIPA